MHRFPRLHEALDYAAAAHNGQLRKGTQMPYLGHLVGVCSLVLEHGGDEDQAIAGLLHDVLEDCGAQHAPVIAAKFGQRVLAIVKACTDGVPGSDGAKDPWEMRKRAYLDHLRVAPADMLLVSACDKLHNARSIAADVRVGIDVFSRFKAGRDGTLWYYRSLLEVLQERLGGAPALVSELQIAVSAMNETSRSSEQIPTLRTPTWGSNEFPTVVNE